jgi:exonuclease III
MTLRLISWNVAARRQLLPRQAEALLAHRPDIVALQEITATTVGPWREALAEAGLPHVVDSFELAPDRSVLLRPRRYGEVLASRFPLHPLAPDAFAVPWQERVLSAVLDTPHGPVEVHTTHIPPGASNGWIKIDTLNGIYARLACQHPGHRLLCGDFNAPDTELPDGRIVTWAQVIRADGTVTCRKRWRGGPGIDWDRGERAIAEGLAAFDLGDVYRAVNGWDAQDASWYFYGYGLCKGWRFDHVYASRSLGATTCRYLHDLREQGLSDHSPIETCFEPAAPAPISPTRLHR